MNILEYPNNLGHQKHKKHQKHLKPGCAFICSNSNHSFLTENFPNFFLLLPIEFMNFARFFLYSGNFVEFCSLEGYLCFYLFYVRFCLFVFFRLFPFQSPTPPPSAKTPKTVSDKKRFFENVMEDQHKPTPKSGTQYKYFFHLDNHHF